MHVILYVLYKWNIAYCSKKTNNMIQWDKDVKYQFQGSFFLIGL